MALRPPRRARRRTRTNPFGRSLSDEAVGLISGFLLATAATRLLALSAGLEQWTTTWHVIDALTIWLIWPLERVGIGLEPTLIGFLRPLDVIAGAAVVVVALYLLATRTYQRRG